MKHDYIFIGDDKNLFASLGAGKPVFRSNTPKTNHNKDKNKSDSENNDANTDEYDPHYEPIIPLPEAITVTTGEEEETVLFNERTKLYRFDANVWKERGVGELKILHHPQKGKLSLCFLMFSLLYTFLFPYRNL